MKIIYNRLLPFPGYIAMMFCGVALARCKYKPLSAVVVDHEKIHVAQAKECGGYIVFYWRYLWQWIKYGYKNAPFEREAKTYALWPEYLSNREPKAWIKFVR